MSFATAFTLFESEAIAVRAEPPDVVCIDEPGRSERRLRRQDIKGCQPVLVRVYQERHPGTLAGADEGRIVIVLRVEGSPPEVLGPYPWNDGMKAAEGITLAIGNLLIAAPGLSLSITADGSAILFSSTNPSAHPATQAMGLSIGKISVPIPTALLEGVALCLDKDIGAAQVLFTGRPGDVYLSFEMWGRRPWLVGPFLRDEATLVAKGFRAWRDAHPFDREPVDVTETELRAEPERWHGRRIRVEGMWHYGFEQSSFAGAWLSGHRMPEPGSCRVRVVGTWYYSSSGRGYGHMGCWAGQLNADQLKVL